MKRILGGLPLAIILLIATLLWGCAGHNTQSTEDLLSAAGFNVVIASTPKQLNHLAHLPPYKMMKIKRSGKNKYVYADPSRKLIFVGDLFSYDRYKDMRLEKNVTEEDLQDAKFNAEIASGWDVWGPF
ncbi:MAG TPA: hypothetical protein VE641_06620 [Chthoniobacterales bacterium]|jgi:hypothetical protein|nr:hypothetical protein [Chthoniobacterales bacterium]